MLHIEHVTHHGQVIDVGDIDPTLEAHLIQRDHAQNHVHLNAKGKINYSLAVSKQPYIELWYSVVILRSVTVGNQPHTYIDCCSLMKLMTMK